LEQREEETQQLARGTALNRLIKVLIVDDHPLLREGIAAAIAEEPDMSIVGEATNGVEAIQEFRRHRPDVTLLDLQMPGMSGIDAMIVIRRDFPDARFVVLTNHQGDIQAMRALKAGASGYLLKSMLRKEMLDTIRLVASGKRRIPPEVAIELGNHVAEDSLSEREVDVLRRVAAGNSTKIIAGQLQLSEATIKNHMKSILSKLGANDRAHAVMIALKRGFIDG
jgi:DNA-binding NarL/FixJ family response regulator